MPTAVAQLLSLAPTGRALVPKLAALADANDAEFFGHLSDRGSRSTAAHLARDRQEARLEIIACRLTVHFSQPREATDKNANWHDIARNTLEGADSGAQTFPEGVRVLGQSLLADSIWLAVEGPARLQTMAIVECVFGH